MGTKKSASGLVSIRAAAAKAGVSYEKIRKMADMGHIKTYNLGSVITPRYYIREDLISGIAEKGTSHAVNQSENQDNPLI